MSKATIRTVDDGATSPASAELTTRPGDEITVKDADGRSITVRRLSVIEDMHLLKVLGEFNASYFGFCAQVARVCTIGGDPIQMPNSEREIEVIAKRLGRAGIAAINEAIAKSIEDDNEKVKETVGK